MSDIFAIQRVLDGHRAAAVNAATIGAQRSGNGAVIAGTATTPVTFGAP